MNRPAKDGQSIPKNDDDIVVFDDVIRTGTLEACYWIDYFIVIWPTLILIIPVQKKHSHRKGVINLIQKNKLIQLNKVSDKYCASLVNAQVLSSKHNSMSRFAVNKEE